MTGNFSYHFLIFHDFSHIRVAMCYSGSFIEKNNIKGNFCCLNLAILRLYLVSKVRNSHVCSKIGRNGDNKYYFFKIFFNGNSRITHCYSNVGKVMMIGQKIRKWWLKIPSQLHSSSPLN